MPRVVAAASTCPFLALVALLLSGFCRDAIAGGAGALEPSALLTNLAQLRLCAGQKPLVVHPFRIVAEVLDLDSSSGVLVLRDSSGCEFIKLDLQDRTIEPGATVCLEGRGCGVTPRSFGLAIVPGLVVDNDGVHGMTEESGKVFLRAGLNPIAVQWFNRNGSFGLNVEYQGPDLPRQPIPSPLLSRVEIDPAGGATNFSPGLDFRCYEGLWGWLPDFTKHQPVKTGIATNFDLAVRARDEAVGLKFNGFIKIPREGVYTFYDTCDDGSRLYVGEASADVQVLTNGPGPRAAEKVPATSAERNSRPWVMLDGTVDCAGGLAQGGELQMWVGNDDIRVEIFENGPSVPGFPADTKVRVSGIYQDAAAEDGSRVPGMLLVSSWKAVRPAMSATGEKATALPPGETASRTTAIAAITPAAEIKTLTPVLAKQQLPVSIRGVVIATLPSVVRGAVVQDSSKGVFVSLQDIQDPEPLKRGEFCRIDGVTGPGLFAPVVVARRITRLGAGRLPRPLRATRDKLLNGSLDTQYAEIEGVVTAVHNQQMDMLTEGGKITLELSDFQAEDLAGYQNTLVRIRGCAFAFFNPQTHELDVRSLRVMGGVVDVLEPAPRDLFDAPQKGMGELLLYDPKAAPLRRLKICGQVIYGRAGECFLTDGANGIRVTTRDPDLFAAGELVDAVGFLELGGAAAELKEAVTRKTGQAPLPAPARLALDKLMPARYASMLVQVDATLVNQWSEGSECVMGLQSGFLTFRARLDGRGQSVPLPPSGSRLELTGVCAAQGSRPGNGTVNNFELLLSSPAGVRVLATPPWWTLKRLLALAVILAALLGAVLIWNKELHRLVQERTRKMEVEIRSRQRAELRHAAEAERSRIARDLHDELGTGLTEVSLVAGAGLGEFQGVELARNRFSAIADKARALVSGLDVIVWAIDPKRNSLQSFADYLGRYASELFSATGIVCRFKIPIECEAVALSEATRHSLFLAVKETLNNVIRHASATEVRLQMAQARNHLEIIIADNGRGFDWNTIRRGNGLTNLHERLKALGGQCCVESQAGKGTTVKFIIALAGEPG